MDKNDNHYEGEYRVSGGNHHNNSRKDRNRMKVSGRHLLTTNYSHATLTPAEKKARKNINKKG